jgi:hypothetical protein
MTNEVQLSAIFDADDQAGYSRCLVPCCAFLTIAATMRGTEALLDASNARSVARGHKPLPAFDPVLRPRLWHQLLALGTEHARCVLLDGAADATKMSKALELVRRSFQASHTSWSCDQNDGQPSRRAETTAGTSGPTAGAPACPGPSPRLGELERLPRHQRRTAAVCAAVLGVSPAAAQLGFLPVLALAFVRLWGADTAASAAAVLRVLGWGARAEWFKYAPYAPFGLLGALDARLRRLDPALHGALQSPRGGGGGGGLGPLEYLWPLLRTCLAEVLPSSEWEELMDHCWISCGASAPSAAALSEVRQRGSSRGSSEQAPSSPMALLEALVLAFLMVGPLRARAVDGRGLPLTAQSFRQPCRRRGNGEDEGQGPLEPIELPRLLRTAKRLAALEGYHVRRHNEAAEGRRATARAQPPPPAAPEEEAKEGEGEGDGVSGAWVDHVGAAMAEAAQAAVVGYTRRVWEQCERAEQARTTRLSPPMTGPSPPRLDGEDGGLPLPAAAPLHAANANAAANGGINSPEGVRLVGRPAPPQRDPGAAVLARQGVLATVLARSPESRGGSPVQPPPPPPLGHARSPIGGDEGNGSPVGAGDAARARGGRGGSPSSGVVPMAAARRARLARQLDLDSQLRTRAAQRFLPLPGGEPGGGGGGGPTPGLALRQLPSPHVGNVDRSAPVLAGAGHLELLASSSPSPSSCCSSPRGSPTPTRTGVARTLHYEEAAPSGGDQEQDNGGRG